MLSKMKVEKLQRNRFAVVGCGSGGMATAAHLALQGNEVHLYEFPGFEENIAPVQQLGGIKLTGEIEGFARLTAITTNVEEAVRGAEVIIVVIPANIHKKAAELFLPHLDDEQIVVLHPGRTGGALEWYNISTQFSKNITIAETQTLLYACRKTDLVTVNIKDVKREALLGVLPSKSTDRTIQKLRTPFPQFKAAENVLETSLGNIGAVFHPALAIFNVYRIERGENFKFYSEGVTKTIGEILEIVDEERCRVARAAKVRFFSAKEWLQRSYGVQGDSLYEAIHKQQAYGTIVAPHVLHNRFILEDVPTGLVPLSSFGEYFNVRIPNIHALITLASSMLGIDFRKVGRTVDNLGIRDMTLKQLKSFLTNGVR